MHLAAQPKQRIKTCISIEDADYNTDIETGDAHLTEAVDFAMEKLKEISQEINSSTGSSQDDAQEQTSASGTTNNVELQEDDQSGDIKNDNISDDSSVDGYQSDYYRDIETEDEPEPFQKSTESPLLDFTHIQNLGIPIEGSAANRTTAAMPPPELPELPSFDIDPCYRVPDITDSMFAMVTCTLKEIGIQDPEQLCTGWTSHKFRAVANFSEACIKHNLPWRLGSQQFNVFFEALDKKYYCLASLHRNWKTIKQIAKHEQYRIPPEHDLKFEFLAGKSRQLKDARLAVNMLLLRQLLAAAMKVFARYNYLLVSTIFICAYSFLMWVGEYMEEENRKRGLFYKSHNVLQWAIRVWEETLGIAFQSDKTFRFAHAIKHRSIHWHKLPPGCKETITQYKAECPEGAKFFFLY